MYFHHSELDGHGLASVGTRHSDSHDRKMSIRTFQAGPVSAFSFAHISLRAVIAVLIRILNGARKTPADALRRTSSLTMERTRDIV